MSRENVEAAHRVTSAVSRRDIDGLIGVTDPEVEWVSVLTPLLGVYEGHDGMRRYVSELAEAFESLETTWMSCLASVIS